MHQKLYFNFLYTTMIHKVKRIIWYRTLQFIKCTTERWLWMLFSNNKCTIILLSIVLNLSALKKTTITFDWSMVVLFVQNCKLALKLNCYQQSVKLKHSIECLAYFGKAWNKFITLWSYILFTQDFNRICRNSIESQAAFDKV